jgi:long-chain fatty acid transport protein
MRSAYRLSIVAFFVLAMAPLALASGFHVYEQGGKASGQAVAFIARADDASAMFYNPAAITKLEGHQVVFGFSGVFLGNTDFKPGPLDPLLSAATPFGDAGFPRLFDATTISMEDNVPTPVHLAYAQKIGDSRFSIGFGISTPFGLVTEWGPEATTRYAALDAELQVIDFAVNGAVDFGNGWSVSLGLDYVMADLKKFSRTLFVPVNLDANPATFEQFVDTRSNLDGDGNEIGFNVSTHFRNDNWAFGAIYRSKVDIEADAQASFDPLRAYAFVSPETGLPPTEGIGLLTIPLNPVVDAGVRAALPSGPAKGTLRLPATYGFGLSYLGFEKWEIELDVTRIEWSHFDEIPIDFQTNTSSLADTSVVENWEDTTSIRLGSSYSLNEKHQLRAGVYVEDTPIPLTYLRPSVPDSDRTGVTLGYGFNTGKFGLDFYAMRIMTDDTTVGLADRDLPATDSPTYLLSVIQEQSRVGSYESTIDLVGLTASFKF